MAIEFDVVVKIPRGSFLKRGSMGAIDFISALPCPFNLASTACSTMLAIDRAART